MVVSLRTSKESMPTMLYYHYQQNNVKLLPSANFSIEWQAYFQCKQ